MVHEGGSNYKHISGSTNARDKDPYFTHRSTPDLRKALPSDGKTSKVRQQISYKYRGPVDVSYVPRGARFPVPHSFVPKGYGQLASRDVHSLPDLDRTKPMIRHEAGRNGDFHLLEVQVVHVRPGAVQTDCSRSPKRRWSISEGSSLAFSYKLSSDRDVVLPRDSLSVVPIPTPSLAPKPSLSDVLSFTSPATFIPPSAGSVRLDHRPRARDSVTDIRSNFGSERAASIKSTSTDHWNNVYSGKQEAQTPAAQQHISSEDRSCTEVMDPAQQSKVPPPDSASGKTQVLFAPCQAREWATRPRVGRQTSLFAFTASQAKDLAAPPGQGSASMSSETRQAARLSHTSSAVACCPTWNQTQAVNVKHRRQSRGCPRAHLTRFWWFRENGEARWTRFNVLDARG